MFVKNKQTGDEVKNTLLSQDYNKTFRTKGPKWGLVGPKIVFYDRDTVEVIVKF